MDELDPSKFEATARKVLFGLGFNHTMQERMTKDSGARAHIPIIILLP